MSQDADTVGAGDEPPPERPSPRGRSVRQQLALFTVSLAAPTLLFAAIVLWQFATQERTRLQRDAIDTARTVALSLDRDLTGLVAALDVLSNSPYLAAGDLDGFYRQAEQLAQRQGIVPVLTDMQGRQLVNLSVPRGTPLSTTNQPWDGGAIASGRTFVTDLFTGTLSGQLRFVIATPVSRDGTPSYVLSFRIEIARLRRLLAEADIPPGYTASIVDRTGRIMARTVRNDEFAGRSAPDDFLRQTTGQQGTWSGLAADGTDVFSAYSRSRLSGFRAAVGVPVAELDAPLMRSLSLFAALFAVTAALSTILAFLFGSRITGPIRALARTAATLGRGEPVPETATGLAEANFVGHELAVASRSLRAREGELREANEEIQRFAYIVSHDLRSPLVNIMGFTTELEALRQDVFRRLDELRPAGLSAERAADGRMAEDFDEAIGFIKTSIGKMDRLIGAILRLSREGRRVFTPERLDMDALVDGIAKGLAHQADLAGVTITAGPLPAIRSDRIALEQVFTNLVDNAIKYMRPGQPGRIAVTGRTTRATLEYAVADNGRGIDPRDGERVFELFRRSGVQDRPGEGIGLAHVRALVRRLGGTITLTSALGQGSTFTVVLPRRWNDEPQGKAA